MALWIPPLCIILSASPTHPLASLPGQSLSRCPRPRRYLSLIRRYYYIHTRMRGHTGDSLSVCLAPIGIATNEQAILGLFELPTKIYTNDLYIYITGGWLVDWLVGWTGARDGTDGRLDFQGRLGTVSQSLIPFPFSPFLCASASPASLCYSLPSALCVCVQMGGENKQELQMRHFLIAEPFWAIGCFPFPNSPPPSSPLPLFTLLTFIIHLVIFCRPPSSSLSPSPLPIKPLSFSFLLYFFLLYFFFFFFAFLSYYYHYHAFPPFFFSLSLS